MVDKKYPYIKGYSIKNIPKLPMKEVIDSLLNKFIYTNQLHVIEGEGCIQTILNHELRSIIESYINDSTYYNLIDFEVVNISKNNKTVLNIRPNNLFSLIIFYFYEIPDVHVLPSLGKHKNLEKFDYKEHSFWFNENGDPNVVNINVDKCNTTINKFNL